MKTYPRKTPIWFYIILYVIAFVIGVWLSFGGVIK